MVCSNDSIRRENSSSTTKLAVVGREGNKRQQKHQPMISTTTTTTRTTTTTTTFFSNLQLTAKCSIRTGTRVLRRSILHIFFIFTVIVSELIAAIYFHLIFCRPPLVLLWHRRYHPQSQLRLCVFVPPSGCSRDPV